MKRIFYKVISPFRTFYWRIFRPKTFGVKVLIENNGKFLMIRNSYGHGHWTFPGGGKKLIEIAEEGARREAKEEVGIFLRNLTYLGKYFSIRQYKKDTVYCFYSKIDNPVFEIDGDEVAEANWFPIPEIPQFRSAAVDDVLDLYKKLPK